MRFAPRLAAAVVRFADLAAVLPVVVVARFAVDAVFLADDLAVVAVPLAPLLAAFAVERAPRRAVFAVRPAPSTAAEPAWRTPRARFLAVFDPVGADAGARAVQDPCDQVLHRADTAVRDTAHGVTDLVDDARRRPGHQVPGGVSGDRGCGRVGAPSFA